MRDGPSCVSASGSRSGNIHHHDVRVLDHHISTVTGHSQEVCGLQWSPDGRYLASGGNDNWVYVWPRVQEGGVGNSSQAVCSWSEHQGAVKASSFISEQEPHNFLPSSLPFLRAGTVPRLRTSSVLDCGV